MLNEYVRAIKNLTNWTPLKDNRFLVNVSKNEFLKTIRNIFSQSYIEGIENTKRLIVIGVGKDEFDMDIKITFDITRGLISVERY